MSKIIRQVTLDSATRRKDRSVKLSFTTTLEQSTQEFMECDEMVNGIGILYFKNDGDLTQAEIDLIDDCDIELEGKTKSQRLRNVLYLLHAQSDSTKDFKQFYSDVMEQEITRFKKMLDSE